MCVECQNAFSFVKPPVCLKCGKKLDNKDLALCYDCGKREFSYDRGFALWNYDSGLRRSIAAFKYEGRADYSEFYTEMIYLRFGKMLRKMGIEYIVEVPIHKSRLNQRGYNQAELIARKLAKKCQIKHKELLLRVKNTQPQKALSDIQRKKNLESAFIVNKQFINQIKCSKILIIDDIYTTGSTIDMCAKSLKEFGVDKVYFIVLAIGQGF